MVFKIVWTPVGLQSYLAIMDFVEKEWSEREVKEFSNHIEDRIKILSQQPYIGIMRNSTNEFLRSIVLHKRVILVYKVRPIKKQIELSLFWNTYQNPGKLKAI